MGIHPRTATPSVWIGGVRNACYGTPIKDVQKDNEEPVRKPKEQWRCNICTVLPVAVCATTGRLTSEANSATKIPITASNANDALRINIGISSFSHNEVGMAR